MFPSFPWKSVWGFAILLRSAFQNLFSFQNWVFKWNQDLLLLPSFAFNSPAFFLQNCFLQFQNFNFQFAFPGKCQTRLLQSPWWSHWRSSARGLLSWSRQSNQRCSCLAQPQWFAFAKSSCLLGSFQTLLFALCRWVWRKIKRLLQLEFVPVSPDLLPKRC